MPPELLSKARRQVGTISVIEYALQTHEQAGIHKHAVVVGRGGERVMETLAARAITSSSRTRRSPGHRRRGALRGRDVAGIDRPEYVLIAAGDKVIAPEVIRGLMERFAASGNNLCLMPAAAAISRRGADRPARRARTGDHRGAGHQGPATRRAPEVLAEKQNDDGRATRRARGTIVSMKKLGTVFPALKRLTSGPPEKKVPWETMPRPRGNPRRLRPALRPGAGAGSVRGDLVEPQCVRGPIRGHQQRRRTAPRRQRAARVVPDGHREDSRLQGRRCGPVPGAEPGGLHGVQHRAGLEEVRKVYALRSISAEKYPGVETWANCFAARNEKGLLAQAVEGLGRRIGSAKTCILVRSRA